MAGSCLMRSVVTYHASLLKIFAQHELYVVSCSLGIQQLLLFQFDFLGWFMQQGQQLAPHQAAFAIWQASLDVMT